MLQKVPARLRLLALKFLETYVLLFSSNNDDSERPVTEGIFIFIIPEFRVLMYHEKLNLCLVQGASLIGGHVFNKFSCSKLNLHLSFYHENYKLIQCV